MDELNMDDYDKEESGVQMFLGGQNMTVFTDNQNDPYITVEHPDDDSEQEDAAINATDFVLIAGHTEQEYSSAEVHIFDKDRSAVYVHHDIVLPSFPLCMSYYSNGDAKSEERRNYLAVGTFEPAIEIWDLDVVDAIEPVAALGGREEPKPVQFSKKKKGKKRKSKKTKSLKEALLGKFKPGSHKQGVMGISWSPHNKAYIASGSADETVKLWDVPNTKCTSTLKHHSGKVQAVEWNPVEVNILLTGGYDRQCACVDARDPKSVKRYQMDGEVQSISWNPLNAAIFAASSDTGAVAFYDVRKDGSQTKPLFTIGAHDGETSGVMFNSRHRHMLASCGVDESIKIWDLSSKPVCIERKDLKIGKLFAMTFNGEDPDVIAAGGSGGKIAIWDIMESSAMRSAYGASRSKPTKK
eukprot:CAMPEP_0114511502 /NCGR_PEP_ID=MMETSP0109-20121206/14433_1 /TAXON_ID=29199 /ORGANISM="Chlorarachnion reptans, Strain CCCM449" /LENGTH=410 /DNA_ID=CAMNT_0001691037 /DNA_START=42 /DNA_END=1274 /DNA_ORIENTATION=-